jgi:hypothetical protein
MMKCCNFEKLQFCKTTVFIIGSSKSLSDFLFKLVISLRQPYSMEGKSKESGKGKEGVLSKVAKLMATDEKSSEDDSKENHDISGIVSKALVEKHVEECPIVNVVVYRDRAEVTRSATLICSEPGETHLYIYSLTKFVNSDSVRVKTVDCDCNILEVSHEVSFQPKASEDNSNTSMTVVNGVKATVEKLTDRLKECEGKLKRLLSHREFVNSYAQTIVGHKPALENPMKAAVSAVAERPTVKEVREVLEFYNEETARIDEDTLLYTKEKSTIENELAIQRKKLLDLTNELSTLNHDETKSLLLILETRRPAEEVKLQFSYVVSNATWSPSYDIRVNNSDNTLALSYFAEVTQKTGENWNDCGLFLSTSNPSIGSTPPPLPHKTIDFQTSWSMSRQAEKKGRKSGFAAPPMPKSVNMRGGAGGFEDDDEDGRRYSFSLLDEQMAPGGGVPMSFQTQLPSDHVKAGVVGSGDAGSTLFTINRKVSIECDNKPHKVMITARSFRPAMVHYAVPSVSSHVYIQAKTKNSSPYPLLASDNVSIYLDGNFISKSSLKQTSSGESFQIFIGVDPAVKLEYLPVRNEEYKKGWVSGTEVKKISHSTILHNTKSSAIKVILAEVLPRSSNEKIAIELMEPAPSSLVDKGSSSSSPIATSAEDAIASLFGSSEAVAGDENNNDPSASLPKDFVTKNKITNNIVWLKTFQPGEKSQINFVYKISWPQGSFITEYNS